VNWMDRLNERAELMGKMLDTIGALDNIPTVMQTDSELRSAAIRCINCRDIETCKTWLKDHPEGAAKAPPHCPNATLFNGWLND
jgi:uncharacterized protein DUF6455